MQSIYRIIRSATVRGYYWLLDYAYVARRMIVDVCTRHDASQYIHPDASKGTVILVPGVYERWYFMKPIADMLYRNGYDIHVIENLGLNTGQVMEMSSRVDEYATQHNLQAFSIVAHSKGGLVAKYLIPHTRLSIEKVITINTPFVGSIYASLFLIPSIRIFSPWSKVIRQLTLDRRSNQKIVSIYGQFDPHIPKGSYLLGAINIQLDVYGHFRILEDERVHAAILRNLV